MQLNYRSLDKCTYKYPRRHTLIIFPKYIFFLCKLLNHNNILFTFTIWTIGYILRFFNGHKYSSNLIRNVEKILLNFIPFDSWFLCIKIIQIFTFLCIFVNKTNKLLLIQKFRWPKLFVWLKNRHICLILDTRIFFSARLLYNILWK